MIYSYSFVNINFNILRRSYELCTLYGLYVVDEANIETHGMKPYTGRLADDPNWKQVVVYHTLIPPVIALLNSLGSFLFLNFKLL